jgi:hypothetical protein
MPAVDSTPAMPTEERYDPRHPGPWVTGAMRLQLAEERPTPALLPSRADVEREREVQLATREEFLATIADPAEREKERRRLEQADASTVSVECERLADAIAQHLYGCDAKQVPSTERLHRLYSCAQFTLNRMREVR